MTLQAAFEQMMKNPDLIAYRGGLLRSTVAGRTEFRCAEKWDRVPPAPVADDREDWGVMLQSEMGNYEHVLPLSPSTVDISTVAEYGLTQKLSSSIRCY